MFERSITFNFDSNIVNTDTPYTYIENTYVIKTTFVDDNGDPVDLSAYTNLEAGLGNISSSSPLVDATNIQDIALWADANAAAGKIVCLLTLTTPALVTDMGSTSTKEYYFQIIGSDTTIAPDNYNTLCLAPIYTRNTIWRP